MELKDLETFLLIVQTGSFTEAAKALFLTQPGISRRIRHLEEELQCKLFEKVGNRLLVTPDGRDLIPLAESVLQSLNSVKQTFERKRGRLSNITIVFSSTLAGTTFTARFQELQKAFPHVEQFHMRILNDDQLSHSVAKGEADIGIRFFRDDNPLLSSHLLHDDPFVLVRSGHSQWFANGHPVSLAQLSCVPWINLTKLSYFFDPITQVQQLTDQIMKTVDIEQRHMIESYGWGVTKSLVEQDHGIAFLPYSKVCPEVERGDFRILDLPIHPTIPICGIHRRHDIHADTWLEILNFLAAKDPS